MDYLPTGQNITGQYNANFLDEFQQKFIKKPTLVKKKVMFHQYNARPHRCIVVVAKIHELRYEL